jgi:hypothetical protein
MKNLIIHIGPHKTGSTFIQKYLFEHRELLKDHGILYGDDRWISQYGHSEAADPAHLNDLTEYIQKLQGENLMRSTWSLLLSSENFDRWAADSIFKLTSLFESVEIIYVFREPATVLYSHWQEYVKFGGSRTALEFIFDHFQRPTTSEIMNPSLIADRWFDASEACRIRVLNYDYVKITGGNLADEFFRIFLGPDFQLNANRDQENKSFRPERAELLRALNSMAISTGRSPSVTLRNTFLKIVEDERVVRLEQFIAQNIINLNINISREYREVISKFAAKYNPFSTNYIDQNFMKLDFPIVNSDWHLNGSDIQLALLEVFHDCCLGAFEEQSVGVTAGRSYS